MPIPKPKSDETGDEFMSRCMSDKVMNDEYPDQAQRAAICHSQMKKKESRYDEKGRIIVAEHVPIIFGCDIEEEK